MAFQYFEITRRQLAENVVSSIPQHISKQERQNIIAGLKNAMGDVTSALNAIGTQGWQLVSVVEARSYGSEILYTFMKTI